MAEGSEECWFLSVQEVAEVKSMFWEYVISKCKCKTFKCKPEIKSAFKKRTKLRSRVWKSERSLKTSTLNFNPAFSFSPLSGNIIHQVNMWNDLLDLCLSHLYSRSTTKEKKKTRNTFPFKNVFDLCRKKKEETPKKRFKRSTSLLPPLFIGSH